MGLEETDRYQSPEESCGRITASLRKDCDLIAPKPQPRLRTSEVGRFLRKRQCKGSQIAAKTDRRRNGPPQRRTARRSFPTSEAHPDRSAKLRNAMASKPSPDRITPPLPRSACPDRQRVTTQTCWAHWIYALMAVWSSTALLNHAGIKSVFSSRFRPSVISASQV